MKRQNTDLTKHIQKSRKNVKSNPKPISTELWIQQYEPKTIEDLPFRSPEKEFNQRSDAILWALNRQNPPRLILLTGYFGCGRSSFIKVFSLLHNIKLISFSPDEEYFDITEEDSNLYQKNFNYQFPKYNFLKSFSDFLIKSQAVEQPNQKRLLILENMLISRGDRHGFIDILQKFNRSYSPFPLIWIPDPDDPSIEILRNTPGIEFYEIKFRPCCDTVLKRALKNICSKEGISTKINFSLFTQDNPGDLRLLVNSFQFSPIILQQISRKEKKIKSQNISENTKEDSKSAYEEKILTSNYNMLNPFEAVGKILYQKEVSPEFVLKSSHLTPTQMESQLYENYPAFYNDLDDMFDAAEAFSLSDQFLGAWENPDLIEVGVTLVMGAVKEANRHPQKHGFTPLRKSRYSRLRERTTNENFLCWPGNQMTLEQMDYALFENRDSFYGLYKNVNPYSTVKIKSKEMPDELNLQITENELEEQERIMDEDPIEIDENIEF